jgi:tripartite-type tricarboxylate transporter receptor subunit TctC
MRKTLSRHCERSEAIQNGTAVLDCFVASLLAMTVKCLRAAWLSCAILSAALASASAGTPDAENFYKNKTVLLITSTGVGGTYDVVARLVAKVMPRYLPGHPTMIVQNMPGGGNVLATNYMYAIAPKDGTAIATIHSAMPLHQVLDPRDVRYDADRFAWLGSTGPQNEVILVWRTAGITSLDDATRRDIILGGTGIASGIVIIPAVMNKLLGTKFKIVTGYRTSEDVNLGMERGEVQARAFGIDSIASQHPDWIAEHKVTFLAQAGARRDRRLPDVPLLTELARTDEQRQIFALISSAPALGQPYVAPPGVPPERLALLRQAFAATLKDPAFLAEAEKIRFNVEPMGADEVAQIVHETTHAPADIVATTKAAAGMAAH